MEAFYGIKSKKTEPQKETTIINDETEETIDDENDSHSDAAGQSNGFNIFRNLKEQLAIFVEKMTED